MFLLPRFPAPFPTPIGSAFNLLRAGRTDDEDDLALAGECGWRTGAPDAESRDVDALPWTLSAGIARGQLCAARLVAPRGLADTVAPAIGIVPVPRSDQMVLGVYCCAVCFMTGSLRGGTGGGLFSLALPVTGLERALGELLRPGA